MKVAVATLGGPLSWRANQKISGSVTFVQETADAPVRVFARISGLKPGLHGMHIHQKPITQDILRGASHATQANAKAKANCCDQLGGHFNAGRPLFDKKRPDAGGTKHGQHAGDLDFNVRANTRGDAEASFVDAKISLQPHRANFIGNRSLVVHADPDDKGKGKYRDKDKQLESYVTGNAGKRIACANVVLVL